MIGLNDKHKIMAVVYDTLSGGVLPLQLIYTGKIAARFPKVKFPEDWLLSYTHNHWSNKEKTKEYLQAIIPYAQRKQRKNTERSVKSLPVMTTPILCLTSLNVQIIWFVWSPLK